MKNIILAICLSASFASYAGQEWCSGTIEHTYLSYDGTLYINGTWRGSHTSICNVNGVRLDVSADVCKGWLSIAMAAKLSKTKVILYYPDIPSCGEIPTYEASPRPSYLMLSE